MKSLRKKPHFEKTLLASIFLVFSLYLPTIVSSQSTKVDSLKIELQNHQQKDTTRVNLLHQLAFSSFQSDSESTKLYLEEAEDLSADLNYTKGKAKILYLRGILESRKSNYAKSLLFFKRSLKHYEFIKDQDGIATIHVAFGITNYDLAQYNEALDNYKKAYDIYKDSGNTRNIITCLINIGNVYSELGRYNESIANYKQALPLCKAINDEDGISFVHVNLGVVYKTQSNYPLAIDNFNKRLIYAEKTLDTLSIASTFHSLGDVYTAMRKYDKALEYHKQSLKLAVQKKSKRFIALNNDNIGAIYKQQKKYLTALKYHNNALKTSQEINNLKQVSICFINIGSINLLLNKPLIARENFIKAKESSDKIDHKYVLANSYLGLAETYLYEQNYEKALFFIQKGKKIADDLELIQPQKKAADLLFKTYKYKGDYKKALTNHEEYKKLNDSLFNKDNIEKITQIEYEYKYKQALDSASIRELKLTKTVKATSQNLEQSQRNYLWVIIGFLLTSIVLGGIIFYQKFKHIKSKNKNIIIEQRLLRSQMTPHFMFNSLSVLQGMILNKEPKKAVIYLSKFSKLLRLVLENSREHMVPLRQELDAVNNYVELQNLEADQSFNFTLNIDDTIYTESIKIPPMLIQPFIENAIEHAFVNHKGAKNIKLELTYSNKVLTCAITDNGIGINTEKEEKRSDKKSLATTITAERLKILSKRSKIRTSIKIIDRQANDKQGTKVTLTLPYQYTK